MNKKEHKAPEGFLYLKDGVVSRVIVTLSYSEIDTIDDYELVTEEDYKNYKGDE